MNCVFCRVVEKNDPHHEIVWQDATHLAFLDAYPEHDGHLLVVPRVHTDYLFDLTDEAYDSLFAFTRTVGQKLQAATGCARVILAVEGYEVPHVHIHLIPSERPVELQGLATGALQTPEALSAIAERLRASFQTT
jgi:histidine triad (HIT) family protein